MKVVSKSRFKLWIENLSAADEITNGGAAILRAGYFGKGNDLLTF
jgi:hypothetical protein